MSVATHPVPGSRRLTTLHDLLTELIALHDAGWPGSTPIAIDDADTGWHMIIEEIRESRSVPGRLLIEGAGYHSNDGTLPD